MASISNSTIMAPGTGAMNSQDFEVYGEPVTVSLYPQASLLAAEHFNLMIKAPDNTYVKVVDSGGAVQLNGTRPQVLVNGHGTYRLEAAARTSSTGAFLKR